MLLACALLALAPVAPTGADEPDAAPEAPPAVPDAAAEATPAPDATAEVPAAAPGAARATAVVEAFHAALLDVMQRADALGYEGRAEVLDPVVADTYDIGFMARKSVGRHWKKLEASQQERLVDRFALLTVANYAGRFTGFSGERFETLGHDTGVHDTLLIQTRLVIPDREDVNLDYRLHRTDEGWRVIDVYLNGTISELARRKSEYSGLLKREGYDALMSALENRIATLREEEAT